jgi:hypothetical protein
MLSGDVIKYHQVWYVILRRNGGADSGVDFGRPKSRRLEGVFTCSL